MNYVDAVEAHLTLEPERDVKLEAGAGPLGDTIVQLGNPGIPLHTEIPQMCCAKPNIAKQYCLPRRRTMQD